jgi:glyoxylase-like metal-dependent hydrolase (beta-lactamase superfamily II)
MWLGTAAFAFVLLACAPAEGERAIKKDYPVTKITDRIYVIYGPYEMPNKQNQGFRNNPAFVVTHAGVIVIDPGGGKNVGEMVLKKIRAITDKPVVAVFDTHSHGDHWLGNDAIKRAYPKAVIYGHPNMKAALEAGEGERWVKIMNRETQGETAGTVAVGPDKTVNHGEVIKIGDRQFRIHHYGSAHTDNDLLIEVVEDMVLFVGDVVRVKALGSQEGSFKGNIAAIEKLLSLPVKIFVPGHGPAGGREMLETYNGFLQKLYAAVQELYKLGISDFEMKPKVIETLKEYRGWAEFDTFIGPHVSQVYLEVEKESF